MNKILFIITGSIAASKCEEIFSLLSSDKFMISCVLTKESKKYINIKSIKKYIGNRVFTDKSEKLNKMLHINLSRNNDIILVCPASANTIAKFANGLADNLASNTLLASDKKILFAPAMNSQMWLNKSNQKNVKILKDRGHSFVGPSVGNLKCGEFGVGRICKSRDIIEFIKYNLKIFNLFHNKKCLVTAGPTIEMIDPVRFISNESSGKQGYEIAHQLSLNGAKVILISGPTNLQPPPNVRLLKIKSTEDMYNKVKQFSNVDIGFFAAAVSDFKTAKIYNSKIKKNKSLKINLIKNIDILEKIGNSKTKRPKFLVGFAAETGNLSFAKRKLLNKNCDVIVYNRINKENQVFGSDYNKISIITKNKIKSFRKMTKTNCAKEIIKFVYNYQLVNG
tara:strand:- start:129 stop:1310 length:1182 start_codon:yes stop_codon:yes gene_type:complete